MKIKTKWAYGKDAEYLLSDFSNYDFALVNTEELIGKIKFGSMGGKEINPYELLSNSKASNKRISKILTRWESNEYVDPAMICINSHGRVFIEDGRHRILTAFHLGELHVPVGIRKEDVETLSGLLKLDLL